MSTIESLCHLLSINLKNKFSKKETVILEAALLLGICKEIKESLREQYKDYFNLIKLTMEMENVMLDANYICFAIDDILLSEEYTLAGIAYYTQTPEEVIYEIMLGLHTRPSAYFLQKIIELHSKVKRDLYKEIMKKIIELYLSEE
ncbi:MAG: hypothetical protein JO149_09350 [Gammaproteobacteria bacterium]|nr:hypothetical protein [Gammaproteobacteria bacterium]